MNLIIHAEMEKGKQMVFRMGVLTSKIGTEWGMRITLSADRQRISSREYPSRIATRTKGMQRT